MRRSAACFIVVQALLGCVSGANDCSFLDGLGRRPVHTGAWSHCPLVGFDVAPVDYTPPPSPGLMQVDRDAGVVTFTRSLDGSVITARYRIVP